MVRMFGEYVRLEQEFDAVVVTGDIAESHNLIPLLKLFAEGIGPDKQIYFILGNHDYYGGSIAAVEKSLETPIAPNLTWLDSSEPILLDDKTALVGRFGWYDAMLGDGIGSDVMLHDFRSVKEFRQRFQAHAWEFNYREGGRNRLIRKFRGLATEAAQAVMPKLVAALERRERVVFATHVPPFAGACWHEGRLSDKDWMPWFTCAAMGKMLEKVALAYPSRQILTLCGHTHSAGVYQHAPNLRVLTGAAKYRAPDVAGLITSSNFESWNDST